ncbi:diol dehydratase small subunit [Natranaerofaba carboxydovora]|uniref:diol dehydratase small subunit n=1 Tax=Natranaerofaba carboxydovora TaxID=2742683 RepID=UPI001F136C0B|nr:diol dehydratase small subunit [Natranaerofaba carboxydovora]UMZ72730.1 Propanediol dehydratase small subunit [Natranaerofaba carboxydovora]
MSADKKVTYPLSDNPDQVYTPTGKKMTDVDIERVMNGEIDASDIRISEETLEKQAEIARQDGKEQVAQNLTRAAELTRIPDDRIMEIYNALRPYRSTKQELLAISEELKNEYNATINAELIRESAEVYEERGILKKE